MAEKEENEITVKVLCSENELLDCLIKQGFKEGRTFSLDDYYYIPSELDIIMEILLVKKLLIVIF